MDSFYDAPRRPPVPIPRDMLPANPVVPEISVLCTSNIANNAFVPYNQWKVQQNISKNAFMASNKENFNKEFNQVQQNNSILKKVRFESPLQQQSKPVQHDNLILQKTDEILNKSGLNAYKNEVTRETPIAPSFEQIYMANIPNRQLDLSVIDLPQTLKKPQFEGKNETVDDTSKKIEGNKIKEKHTKDLNPKTYREFLEAEKLKNMVLNDSVTDIFNYKRKSTNDEHTSTRVNNELEGEHNGQEYDLNLLSKKYLKENTKLCNSPKNESRTLFHSKEKIDGLKYSNSKYRHVFQDANISETVNDPLSRGFSSDLNIVQQPTVETRVHRTENQNTHLVNETKNEIPVFLQKINSQHSTPALSNLNSSGSFESNIDCQKKCECKTNPSDNNKISQNSDDLGVKELLNIISQQSKQIAFQNEQILLLQKQVSMLLCREKQNTHPTLKQKSIDCNTNCNCCLEKKYSEENQCCQNVYKSKNPNRLQDRCISSTKHEECNLGVTPRKKNNLQNFSIGLTTSFEVSFRRPQSEPKVSLDHLQTKPLQNYVQEPLKIEEINENNSSGLIREESNKHTFENYSLLDQQNQKTLVDSSMVFKDSVEVKEHCPSPEPSIKIDMNEFEESDSEDELTEVGSQFYKNLMDQINNILQRAQIQTKEMVNNVSDQNHGDKHQQLKNKTMHKVKEATLKHLKNVGIEVPSFEISGSDTSSSLEDADFQISDISFAVKQLLMKYLPSEHLAKVTCKDAPPLNPASVTPKEKIGVIKNRPEFSFATVQYMKKYNLIASDQNGFEKFNKISQPESPKILDISKLKKQPKLL